MFPDHKQAQNLENCWSPLGDAIYDYYHGEMAAHITIKSTIEEDREIPVGTFFREKNRFPYLEKKALKLCKGKVLDVGAGAGPHTLFLQNKGLDVDAMDISSKAVSVMQSRGLKNAFAADIFKLQTEERYDTILLMIN
jgi:2-polyprenyl-3-methyl-5-hydroxy-6-metoxy-1,4-benzoquinol methylase